MKYYKTEQSKHTFGVKKECDQEHALYSRCFMEPRETGVDLTGAAIHPSS